MSSDLSSAVYDSAEKRIRLDLSSADEARQWLDKASVGSFVVRLPVRLREEEEVELLLVSDPLEFPLRCRVTQVFRSGTELYGIMLEWLDVVGPRKRAPWPRVSKRVSTDVSVAFDVAEGARAAVEPSSRGAGTAPVTGRLPLLPPLSTTVREVPEGAAETAPQSAAVTVQDDREENPEAANAGLTPEAKRALVFNETRGLSLAHSVGALNPNEKARLASRASSQERALLMRDTTFSVQMGLLNNPRTEVKEVIEIAKNAQTTGGILKRLASDRKWAGNYEIQIALVKHPQTPSPLAIRLLDQMRISDLRMLAKSQALRENVRKAALRLYLQRAP